ncbi:MAG: GNAT family N-acetyltransferase [Calditrichaeota bacterium]|nr:MAG: GNAT family N-acetyltransferase [Calditrichota bacterium]
MAYLTRVADLRKEKQLLLELLTMNRERSGFPYEKRYEWLYLKNPFGEATAWIIYDDQKNIPVGTTAVFPRKMLVKGKELLAWNCGDFSINRRFRTLGIAMKLRKAAKQCVDEGKVPFLYAHPNDRMVHIHLKVGHKKIALMKRFALPIDVSKVLNKTPVQRTAARVLNPLLKGVLKFKYKKVGEYEFCPAGKANFDYHYREICERINREIPIVGLRDETYLTWKFGKHPVLSYEIFNYYQDNNLTGYVIFVIENDICYLTEIVCDKDSCFSLLSTFLNAIIQHYPHVKSLSTIQQEYNPVVSTLLEVGFRYREDATSSAIAYSNHTSLVDLVHDGRNWFMNVGDRDA